HQSMHRCQTVSNGGKEQGRDAIDSEGKSRTALGQMRWRKLDQAPYLRFDLGSGWQLGDLETSGIDREHVTLLVSQVVGQEERRVIEKGTNLGDLEHRWLRSRAR